MQQRLIGQEDWFPGKKWFLTKKPNETKINVDHTTGLCKDCHSIKINYATVLDKAKQLCSCRSMQCPNWVCLCDEDECICPQECACDDCQTCQVIYL